MTRRRLVLMRHAQAEDGGRDRDRELTKRGVADAAVAGPWLVANDAVPDLVIVSPARRAVQTWEAVAADLPASPEAHYDDRIYDNTVDDLLAVIRDVDATATGVLLVGHNPSMHALAVHLGGKDTSESLQSFSTATVAVLDVEGEWVDVPDIPARLVGVTTCRADAR